jgi:hypothetical protein
LTSLTGSSGLTTPLMPGGSSLSVGVVLSLKHTSAYDNKINT